MKKTILAIVSFGLLLISGCAAPAQTETPVPKTAPPKPTATSIPPSETPAPELSELPWFGVPYITDGNPRQKLDVHFPEVGEGPFPILFASPGGGVVGGNNNSYYKFASYFNELGYALVSIDYRLAPHFN